MNLFHSGISAVWMETDWVQIPVEYARSGTLSEVCLTPIRTR
jgi:hypothetical protein